MVPGSVRARTWSFVHEVHYVTSARLALKGESELANLLVACPRGKAVQRSPSARGHLGWYRGTHVLIVYL